MSAELSKPLVSALMSVHNCRRYFSDAVESILAQTMQDFEFIIVDDGSTDGVTELCKDYASRDTRIRLLLQENKGLTRALNVGLHIARGKFVARMDSDDIAHPTRFVKQTEFLCQHSKAVCVGASVNIVDEDGDFVGVSKRPTDPVEIERLLLAGVGGLIIHPVAMIRRATISRIGGYDERFRRGQDFDLWMRLSEVGQLANLSEALLDWRQHQKSAGFTDSAEQYEVVKTVLKEAYARRGISQNVLPNPPSFVRDKPTDRHVLLSKLAFEQGNLKVARKHANRALSQLRPFSDEWTHMMIIARGSNRWAVIPLKSLRRLKRGVSRLRNILHQR